MLEVSDLKVSYEEFIGSLMILLRAIPGIRGWNVCDMYQCFFNIPFIPWWIEGFSNWSKMLEAQPVLSPFEDMNYKPANWLYYTATTITTI